MIKRFGYTVSGVLLAIAGVFMLVLPGPGIAAILAGLTLVASQFPRGRRRLVRIRQTLRRWWSDYKQQRQPGGVRDSEG